jgi:hypothetical protein
MILPPAIVDIRLAKNGKRSLRLLLPVFLLWPVALAIVLPLLPFALILAVIYPFASPVRKFFGVIHTAMISCCALRGLTFETKRANKVVNVKII